MSKQMDEIAKVRERFEEVWIQHLRVLNDFEIGVRTIDDVEESVRTLTDAQIDLECEHRPVM